MDDDSKLRSVYFDGILTRYLVLLETQKLSKAERKKTMHVKAKPNWKTSGGLEKALF